MSISVEVNTSGFRARYEKYINSIKEQLSSDWSEVTNACLLDVASRTPDAVTEYNYIQGYEGGTFEGQSKSPVTSSGGVRQSFVRDPGKYLQELVWDPSTYTANPASLSLSLGHVEALQEGSRFSWVNYNKVDGAMPHTSTFGVFHAFEYGWSGSQFPAFGENYRLKPYGDDGGQYHSSTKTYPRMGLYTLFSYDVWNTAVCSSAKKVQF